MKREEKKLEEKERLKKLTTNWSRSAEIHKSFNVSKASQIQIACKYFWPFFSFFKKERETFLTLYSVWLSNWTPSDLFSKVLTLDAWDCYTVLLFSVFTWFSEQTKISPRSTKEIFTRDCRNIAHFFCTNDVIQM